MNYLNEHDIIDFNKLDELLIKEYFTKLKTEEISASTFNRRLSSIKKFYKYLVDKGLKEKGSEILIESEKNDEKKIEYLSPEEMTKIINEGLQSDSEYMALKDTAGFSIEYTVTPEKKLASTVSVDMETIDWDKVKDLSYFKDLGIGDLKDIKASTVFTGLKLHGFKEETPAP